MSDNFSIAVSGAPLYVRTPYSIERIIGLIWDDDGIFIESARCILKNEYDGTRRTREDTISLETAFRVNGELTLEYIRNCRVPKVYWERAWYAVYDEQQPDI